MSNTFSTKWDIATVISKGREADQLAVKYNTHLAPRMKPGDLENLAANVETLDANRSGQKGVLVDQKAKTNAQDIALELLHSEIMTTRTQIKASNGNSNILKSFGVGEQVNKKLVSSVISAAKLIEDGFKKHTDWAIGEAGIIEDDITEITALKTKLQSIDTVQENAKIGRKMKTADKNKLQRKIEDLIPEFCTTNDN